MDKLFAVLVVGLVALTQADVSHLKHESFTSNSLTNDNQNYVANTFNAGNTKNSNSRYWWMNTEGSPFTKTHKNHLNQNPNNYNILQTVATVGGQQHQNENNLHETQPQNYIQNQLLNNNRQPHPTQQHNNVYAHGSTFRITQ